MSWRNAAPCSSTRRHTRRSRCRRTHRSSRAAIRSRTASTTTAGFNSRRVCRRWRASSTSRVCTRRRSSRRSCCARRHGLARGFDVYDDRFEGARARASDASALERRGPEVARLTRPRGSRGRRRRFFCGCTSTIPMRPTIRRRRLRRSFPGAPTTARWRAADFGAVDDPCRAAAPSARRYAHRRHRRSRRGPRRARRIGARDSALRRDAARAAGDPGPGRRRRACVSRARCATSICCRRSRNCSASHRRRVWTV